MNRQITEKELKIAAKEIRLQHGLIELLISKVRENQQKNTLKLVKIEHEDVLWFVWLNSDNEIERINTDGSDKCLHEFLNSNTIDDIYWDINHLKSKV